MKTKPKTSKQLQQEIDRLRKLKPLLPRSNAFGESIHDAVDAEIETLEEELDEDDIYARSVAEEDGHECEDKWPERIRAMALDAHRWAIGEDVERPSDGWKPIAQGKS